ncbi:MAG: BspA family leucine-rich repeat surface protein [Bacteroidaceae bacterium]|nr:BspA family leucine-rich repeat surface protein [Bacteroidaceae bacterium]
MKNYFIQRLKSFFAMLVILLFVSANATAQTKEPVAYYNSSTKTLTFTMMTDTEFNNLKYPKWKGQQLYYSDPSWLSYNEEIEKVVFSTSFADARPERCEKWFYNCKKIQNITGLGNLNTSNVTNMDRMFQYCESLTSLDLSKFNTSKVKRMGCMFWGCKSLTKLDLGSFDTSEVETMGSMFYNCTNLKNVNVSSFNTSNVNSMFQMFYGCSSLVKLNLTSFTVSSSTDLEYMFCKCTNLKTIICNRTWESPDDYFMFSGCTSLVGAISYEYLKDRSTYANPDNGYFTRVRGYQLRICGKEVTNVNCDDLSVIEGVTIRASDGYAYYDPYEQRLYLKGVVIAALDNPALYDNSVDDLTVDAEKDNMDYGVTFFSSSSSQSKLSPVMELHGPVLLCGTGKLYVNGIPSSSIYTGNVELGNYAVPGITSNDRLTIEDLWLSVQGSSGICGVSILWPDQPIRYPLSINGDNTYLRVMTNGGPCIYNFDSYPTSLAVRYPEGAVFEDNALRLNGKIVKDLAVIARPIVGTGIYVAGQEVTSDNCDDLTTVKGVEASDGGYLRYDWDTNTLEMENVSINGGDDYALRNTRDGLTVKVGHGHVFGYNTLSVSEGKTAMSIEAATTIKGNGGTFTNDLDGCLLVGGNEAFGIYINNTNLTIEDATVVVTGTLGIWGYSNHGITRGILNLKGLAALAVTGTSSCMDRLQQLNLGDHIQIVKPDGAVFDGNAIREGVGGSIVAGKQVIIQYFNPCDVNLDGNVDISDIVAVINTIAGNDTYKKTADVNLDDNIDISDIVAIINAIAGK